LDLGPYVNRASFSHCREKQKRNTEKVPQVLEFVVKIIGTAATTPPHYASRIDRSYLQRGMSKGLGFRGTKRRRRREESDDANCELWNVCIPDAADGRRKRELDFGWKGFHNEPAATATRRPQAEMQELLLPILPSNADQANGKKKQQEVFSSGIDITPLESLSSQEEEMEAMSQEPLTIDLSR
jgi:hypothetical protein